MNNFDKTRDLIALVRSGGKQQLLTENTINEALHGIEVSKHASQMKEAIASLIVDVEDLHDVGEIDTREYQRLIKIVRGVKKQTDSLYRTLNSRIMGKY